MIVKSEKEVTIGKHSFHAVKYKDEANYTVSVEADDHGNEKYEEVLNTLRSTLVSDFPNGLSVNTMGEYKLPEKDISFLYVDIISVDDRVEIISCFRIAMSYWASPFTFDSFLSALKLRTIQDGYSFKSSASEDGISYIFISQIFDEGLIGDHVDTLLDYVENTSEQVKNILYSESAENSLVKIFKFPSEYLTSCTQYIMWFGEFLSNLGHDVNLSSNTKKDGTATFIISPNDDSILVSEIEKIFHQYLALPYSELLPASGSSNDLALFQLQSQIDHFKSQINAKNAIILAHETTIKCQQDSIVKLSTAISQIQYDKALLIESLKGDKEVELFGGVISIGTIEKGPIKFSPAKLIEKFSKKN